MMIQMTALQQLDGGTPGYLAFGAGAVIYGIVAFLRRGAAKRNALPSDWLGRGAAAAYLLVLAVNMTFFAPETHVSTGLHQVPGPCDVEETDITGAVRNRFLCTDNYEEDFSFACAAPPADGTQWFTICGMAHANYPAYAGAVGGLSLAGMVVFSVLFGRIGSIANRAP
jgi:hypothetical protein